MQAAKDLGIKLKQTFQREGQALARQAGLCARTAVQTPAPGDCAAAHDRGALGARDRAQGCARGQALWQSLREALDKARRIVAQGLSPCRWRAQALQLARPEVECINKGKAQLHLQFLVLKVLL